MPIDAESIVNKLTAQELDFLADRFGANLRDPDALELAESYADTRRRLKGIEEMAIRKLRDHRGEEPHCSFCKAPKTEAGKLCQSSLGPYICLSCAEAAIVLLRNDEKRDA